MSAFTSVPELDVKHNTLYDEVDATTSYFGRGQIGAATSSSVWQIQRLVFTGNNLELKFAGDGQYSQVWDDRASLSY